MVVVKSYLNVNMFTKQINKTISLVRSIPQNIYMKVQQTLNKTTTNKINLDQMLRDVSEQAKIQAESFLALGDDFRLGDLPTEQQAEETLNLAENSQTNLPFAINQVKSLDMKTLRILASKVGELEGMYKSISDTLESGNRVFICGCGATGRLSLALEQLFRQEVAALNRVNLRESVISLMSGGDLALIKSVEDFEDHPEFAEQHMKDIGFGKNDLLISSTEGGETPWVIGATNYAVETSSRLPFFLYCNPDDKLKVQRSKDVINNPKIIKINLTVGPMGITGSTRMQSTTILMYAIGLALFHTYLLTGVSKEKADATFIQATQDKIQVFTDTLEKTNVGESLAPLTEKESAIYQANGYIFYQTTAYFGLSVLTDTTERSPTFSLFPFENQQDLNLPEFKPSLCHLVMVGVEPVEGKTSVESAWFHMLGGREIRGLDSEYWSSYQKKVATKRALGYNFSTDILSLRREYTGNDSKHFFFDVARQTNDLGHAKLIFALRNSENTTKTSQEFDLSPFQNRRLCESIFLKVLLNNHSTLVMCRLHKVKSNIMIWVRPSNFKLIDRAIRYIQYFLDEKREVLQKNNPSALAAINYDLICHALMSETEKLNYGQSIVLNTYKRILFDLFNIIEA